MQLGPTCIQLLCMLLLRGGIAQGVPSTTIILIYWAWTFEF
jgi:hypothetical protein